MCFHEFLYHYSCLTIFGSIGLKQVRPSDMTSNLPHITPHVRRGTYNTERQSAESGETIRRLSERCQAISEVSNNSFIISTVFQPPNDCVYLNLN